MYPRASVSRVFVCFIRAILFQRDIFGMLVRLNVKTTFIHNFFCSARHILYAGVAECKDDLNPPFCVSARHIRLAGAAELKDDLHPPFFLFSATYLTYWRLFTSVSRAFCLVDPRYLFLA